MFLHCVATTCHTNKLRLNIAKKKLGHEKTRAGQLIVQLCCVIVNVDTLTFNYDEMCSCSD